jgi:transcriptional regulator with XRE-family HTH domain
MENTVKIINQLLEQYTQEELSRKLGVSLRSIQNYLSGTEPRKEVARKLQEIRNGHSDKGPVMHPYVEGLVTKKIIQIEAMQRVQITLLKELFAKSQGITSMEAGLIVEKIIGAELQKLSEEL